MDKTPPAGPNTGSEKNDINYLNAEMEMIDTLHVGTWATIDTGCPMNYKFPVDGGISFTFGDLVDLLFDEESLRKLAQLSAAAVRDIDEGMGAAQSVRRTD